MRLEMSHISLDGLYRIRLVRISVDATPAVMLNPAVAMAADVHCQRPPVPQAIFAT